MRRELLVVVSLAAVLLGIGIKAEACTGIALKAKDGSFVPARTVEWAASAMNNGYAVVPRGYTQTSLTPTGESGLTFTARYGYVGIYTEYEKFVVEGVNEAGLSAGLFFFPGSGKYPEFSESRRTLSVSDMQLVSFILSTCGNIDEVKKALETVDVVSLDPRVETVHWRFTQPDGRMVVLEHKDGKPQFFENTLGTLTNSPNFEFHLANLHNYVNLVPGAADKQTLADGLTLTPFGGGSGMLGLPGDFTPPSRFIRAAFFSTTAPEQETAFDAVTQAFHILNNFDLPIGAQHKAGQAPKDLPSATQFTSATDLSSLKFYYKTAWNQNIRCIDLKNIDFRRVKYQVKPLDKSQVQPVEMIAVR